MRTSSKRDGTSPEALAKAVASGSLRGLRAGPTVAAMMVAETLSEPFVILRFANSGMSRATEGRWWAIVCRLLKTP